MGERASSCLSFSRVPEGRNPHLFCNNMVSEESQKEALKLKDEGNTLFKSGNHMKAAGLYAKATKKDPNNHVLFSNLAAALLAPQVWKYKQALTAADQAIALNPEFHKSHFRRGVALTGLQREEEAIEALLRAGDLEPSNMDVPANIIEAIDQCVQRCEEKGEAPPASFEELRKEAEVRGEKVKVATAVKSASAAKKAKEREAALAERAKVKAAEQAKRKKEKKLEEKKRAEEEEAAKKAAVEAARVKAETENRPFLEKEPEADANATSSTREVMEAKARMFSGTLVGYDSSRVMAFARAEMQGLCDPKLRAQYAAPLAIVLPGRVIDGWGDEGSGISIHSAFDSPDAHSQCVAFLRQHSVETGAHAVLLIVRKSLVAYPRVWDEGKGKETWPFEDSDGYMVQLEGCDKRDRRVWFMQLGIGGALTEHELDVDTFRVCQTLLR